MYDYRFSNNDVTTSARISLEASHRVVDQGATIPNGKRYIGVILVTEHQRRIERYTRWHRNFI